MKAWKMNGAGNDFIIINNMEECLSHADLPSLAVRLCERHLSIGADGLMVVERAEEDGDLRMLFYNSDGSVGEMCGNGARCICRYAYENGLAGGVQRVETMSGTVVGYRLDSRNYRIRLNPPTLLELDRRVEANGIGFELSYVELGTPGLPHAVVPIKELESIPDTELAALGRSLRYSTAFSKGANINFYELRADGSVRIRTYERGVEDMTYACGTGTGSTALVLRKKGLVPDGEVTAITRGGVLSVSVIEGKGETELWLTGPTNIVAKIEVTDEEL